MCCFCFIGDANPSPNTYTLPTLLGPRVPTRVSSACYSLASRPKTGGFDTDHAKTPGPAGYGAQNTELYGKKSPAYSILGRQFMPGGRQSIEHSLYLYMLLEN